jgi:hypothetical protein
MSQFLTENDASRSPAWCRTVDTRARARSDEQKGITPCSTLKANPPASGLDRLCYKNGPFVSSGRTDTENAEIHPQSNSSRPSSETIRAIRDLTHVS